VEAHRARRRFGQNFLVDPGAIAAIVAAVDPRPGDHVVEIGPGLGALTGPLARATGSLRVIELDRDLAAALPTRLPGLDLDIHQVDVLRFDFASLPAPLRIVGNLPYNISTPILLRLIEIGDRIHDAHVMLQREVAQRIAASPGGGDYGRLSVVVQYRFEVVPLFDLGPQSFQPSPKVHSSVVRLLPRPQARPRARDERVFARIVQAAFSQRRKMLRNTLRGLFDEADLRALDIDPAARAETLAIADFIRLADARTEPCEAREAPPACRGGTTGAGASPGWRAR